MLLVFYVNGKISNSGITLLVIRINSFGFLCNSKPCSECVKKIKRASRYLNIKKIVYSTENNTYESVSVENLENEHKSLYYRAMRG